MKCPKCGIALDVAGLVGGTKVRCPSCLDTVAIKYDEPRTQLLALGSLAVEGPGGRRETYELRKTRVTVGAAADNDLVVDDPARTVSRRHAAVYATPEGYFVEDLGSTNGTYLAGERLEPGRRYQLAPGDEVWLGPAVKLVARAAEGDAGEAGVPATRIQEISPGSKDEVIIGRGADCDWVISYPQVSRRHAVLKRVAGGFVVRDLGSLNGTFVNGRRVQEAFVSEGDVVGIGPYNLVVRAEALEGASSEGALRVDAVDLSREVDGGRRILNDVSFTVMPRDFVGILGGSGAGKSVLMAALNGSARATSGRVLFNGQDLYRDFDYFRQQIGYVPQRDIIHSELSAERIFWYTAKLRLPGDTSPDEIERRIETTLEVLNLTAQRRLPFRVLSGGQQKRVNLGVELVTAPTVFFLDEPTSGLDPGLECEMMSLFRKIAKEEGKTVACVTHVTENIKLMDKVAILAPGGYLSYYGPPEDAPAFFDAASFTDIYGALKRGQSQPTFWPDKFRKTNAHREYVVAPAEGVPTEGDAKSDITRKPRKPKAKWLRQLWLLGRRYAEIMTRDRRNTLLLLAQAPAVAVLLALVFHGISKVAPDAFPYADALNETLLFALALSAMWFGTNNAAKEITKEAEVYRRERMVNLRVGPYLLSKVAVLGALALIQCALLLGVVKLAIGLPGKLGEIYLILALVGLAGVTLGLAVSALAGSTDKAVALVPILLIPQIIFAGVLRPVEDMDVVSRQISNLMAVRWGYETARDVAVGPAPKRAEPTPIMGPLPAPEVMGPLPAPGSAERPAPAPKPASVAPLPAREITYADFRRNLIILFIFSPAALAVSWLGLVWQGRKGFERR